MASLRGKRILIKADASYDIGTGHVMRMAALAGGMKKFGADIVFACRLLDGNMNAFLRAQGFVVTDLPKVSGYDIKQSDSRTWLGADIVQDLDDTFRFGGCDILVADQYGIDRSWCTGARAHAKLVVCVDDEGKRALDCDMLINQNYFSDNGMPEQDVPEHCLKLVGPPYAMLRPEFAVMRAKTKRRAALNSLLVIMGGRDVNGIGLRIAAALNPDINTTFIGGGDALRELCAEKSFRYLERSDDISSEMSRADFCIGAAGSTTWERCCLYLPSALFILAENQQVIADNLANADICLNLGPHETFDYASINSVLKEMNGSKLEAMSEKCGRLVDGLGVDRIIDKIQERCQ